MKKAVAAVAAVMMLLAAVGALAESPYDFDNRFIQGVQWNLSSKVDWRRSVDNDGTFVTIKETGYVHGQECEVTMIGYSDRVYQVCITLPFNRLTMDSNGIFSDELFIYNTFYYLAMSQIPKNSEPYEIYSPYDIQYTISSGAAYSSSYLKDGWEWITKERGTVDVRRVDYPNRYFVEAHLLNNGMVWFNFQF
jgi:hypothetical protein